MMDENLQPHKIIFLYCSEPMAYVRSTPLGEFTVHHACGIQHGPAYRHQVPAQIIFRRQIKSHTKPLKDSRVQYPSVKELGDPGQTTQGMTLKPNLGIPTGSL